MKSVEVARLVITSFTGYLEESDDAVELRVDRLPEVGLRGWDVSLGNKVDSYNILTQL